MKRWFTLATLAGLAYVEQSADRELAAQFADACYQVVKPRPVAKIVLLAASISMARHEPGISGLLLQRLWTTAQS